jgi:hypothetical protein
MEVSARLKVPATLFPGKEPPNPLDGKLGGPQSRSGRDGEEKHSYPLAGLESPIVQPVAQRYTTELSRNLALCKYGYSKSAVEVSILHKMNAPFNHDLLEHGNQSVWCFYHII